MKMNALQFLKVQQNSATPVQNRWFLHSKPPFVEVKSSDGYTYRIGRDGDSRVLIGENELPSPYCPFPWLVVLLNVYTISYRMRKNIAYALAVSFVLTVAILFASAYLVATHPAAGEMLTNSIISALLWFVAIASTAAAIRIGWGFYKSARYVWESEVQRYQEAQKELPAQAASALDISPDILVMQQPNETDAEFVNRVEQAKTEAGYGVWLLAFAYREPIGTIWQSPTKSMLFARNDPPFQNESWTDDQRIVPLNAVFDNESAEDFRLYIELFVQYYRKWAPLRKVSDSDPREAGQTWLDSIRAKTAAATLALLFFCIGLFSQSAAQVEKATSGMTVPEKHADVSYQFEKKTFGRVGNGRSNYADLLRNIPAYRDCCHGSLIAVYKDGELIAKGASVEQVAAISDPIRPRGSVVQPETVEGFEFPDSNSMAGMAERTKYQIDKFGKMAGDGIRPWWDVVMHLLWAMFPFLIIAGAISWLFAGVCAREGMIELHKRSRRVFAVIALSFAAAILVNFLLYAISLGFSPLALSIVAAIETAIAYFIVTWMVPDFRPAMGNEPERRNYNNFPRIGP